VNNSPILRRAGPQTQKLVEEYVNSNGGLKPGKAFHTTGGQLRARYIIHAALPTWTGGTNNEMQKISEAYLECYKLAN